MNNTINNLIDSLNGDENTPFNGYGIIYKITNTYNDKIYIGQTIYTTLKRWAAHVRSQCKTPFKRAINKYGKKSFIVEEIDIAYSKNELNYLEEYWIKFYRSTESKYGYNISLGGNHVQLSREYRLKRAKFFIKCVEENVIYCTVKDAEKCMGIFGEGIDRAAVDGGTAGGFHWERIDKNSIDFNKVVTQLFSIAKKKPTTHVKEVVCVQAGETYKSMSGLGRILKISLGYASAMIRKKFKAQWIELQI